jgi:hypothetical protein
MVRFGWRVAARQFSDGGSPYMGRQERWDAFDMIARVCDG